MVLHRPVLVVGTFGVAPRGGVERVIQDNFRLCSDGGQVEHILLATAGEPPSQFRNVTLGRARLRGLILARGTRGLLRGFAAQQHSACLHLHSVFYPLNLRLALIANRVKLPVIYTPHDSSIGIRHGSKSSRLAKGLYFRIIERWLLAKCDRIQALSLDQKKYLTGITDTPVVFVPNYVPKMEMAEHDESTLPKGSYLVSVGRFDVLQKGIDILLRGYASALSTLGDGTLKLVMVGSGSAGEVEQLGELIKSMRLDANITVLENIDDDAKARWIENAWYIVQFSRFEGFGLSIAEAASVAVPCLTSRHVPVGCQLELAGGGVTLDDLRAVSVGRALFEIMSSSEEERNQAGAAAARLWKTEWSEEAAKRNIVTLYTWPDPI